MEYFFHFVSDRKGIEETTDLVNSDFEFIAALLGVRDFVFPFLYFFYPVNYCAKIRVRAERIPRWITNPWIPTD